MDRLTQEKKERVGSSSFQRGTLSLLLAAVVAAIVNNG
jgi:hypothetical protein